MVGAVPAPLRAWSALVSVQVIMTGFLRWCGGVLRLSGPLRLVFSGSVDRGGGDNRSPATWGLQGHREREVGDSDGVAEQTKHLPQPQHHRVCRIAGRVSVTVE